LLKDLWLATLTVIANPKIFTIPVRFMLQVAEESGCEKPRVSMPFQKVRKVRGRR